MKYFRGHIFAVAFAATLMLVAGVVKGQQAEPQVKPSPTPIPVQCLVPGDELALSVRGMPELDWKGEVDAEGNITFPFIDKTIVAVCRTLEEVTEDVKNGYNKFLKKNQLVTLRITNRGTSPSPITLLGAVKTPSRVQLLRPNVRLPELLAAVGGLTDKAGKTVVILPAEKSWCSESAVLRQNVELGWPLAYRLDEALSANEKTGPLIFPGDMVAILEDDLVYVEDFVTGPGGFPFAPGVTVTQIIEKAGGLDSAARKQKIYIRRLEAGHGAKTNIKVNWEAIKAGKEPDIPLLPNDVVIVPSGANFLSANGLLNFCASCSAYFWHGILPRVSLSNEPRIIR